MTTIQRRSIAAAILLVASLTALVRTEPAGVSRSFKTWSQYLGGADSSQYSALDQINKSNVVAARGRLAVLERRFEKLPLQSDRRRRHDVRAGEEQLDRGARRGDRAGEVVARQRRRSQRSRDQLLGERRSIRPPAAVSERRIADGDRRADRQRDCRHSATTGASTSASGCIATSPNIRPLQTNNPGRIYRDLFIVSLPAGGAGYVASPGDIHAYDVRSGKLSGCSTPCPSAAS